MFGGGRRAFGPRRKAVAFVVAAVIAVVASAVFDIARDRRAQIESARRAADNMSTLVARHFEETFGAIAAELDHASVYLRGAADDVEMRGVLRSEEHTSELQSLM